MWDLFEKREKLDLRRSTKCIKKINLTCFVSRWTDESILKGNLLSNIHLLMAIVDHYTRTGRIILELPKTPLKVTVVSVSKKNGQMIYEKSSENLIRY